MLRLATHTLSSSGGGLIGAVKLDSANASVRQQMSRNLSGSIAAGYAQNDVVGSALLGNYERAYDFGYGVVAAAVGQASRCKPAIPGLRQDYSGVAVLAATPNTNREFVSISYRFSRPLGR